MFLHRNISFINVAIALMLLILGLAFYYFSHGSASDKAFQLAFLVGIGTLLVGTMLFIIISLIMPLLPPSYRYRKKRERKENQLHDETDNGHKQALHPTREKMQQLVQGEGENEEIHLVLPYELTFFLAKEAITNLFGGKITHADEESGEIKGRSGWAWMAQEIRISLHSVSKPFITVSVSSRNAAKKEANEKSRRTIAEIISFLKAREHFYLG